MTTDDPHAPSLGRLSSFGAIASACGWTCSVRRDQCQRGIGGTPPSASAVATVVRNVAATRIAEMMSVRVRWICTAGAPSPPEPRA
jgi:hypothetical protein